MRAPRVPLRIELPAYHHARSIAWGEQEIAGTDVAYLTRPEPRGALALAAADDWDVAEVSAADLIGRRDETGDAFAAIPVFLGRSFVHRCLWARAGRTIGDLRGGVLAVPGAHSSERLWAMGLLHDEHGLEPGDVELVELDPAALDEPPAGVDAVIAPSTRERAHRYREQRLHPAYPDAESAEREWLASTGILPIQRIMVLRGALVQQHRWLASNVYRAFEAARRAYFERVIDHRASRVPVPGIRDHVADLRRAFGPEPWEYGLAANDASLRALVRNASTQGVATGLPAEPAELFWPVEPFVDWT